jgi:hypothetical protein
VARFRTPRDGDESTHAAYCRIRSGALYCWTPNDGFTIEMAEGPAERVLPNERNAGREPQGYPTLGFGEVKKIGDFTCTSRTSAEGGLSCQGTSGYGWQMPRYRGCPRLNGPSGPLAINLCEQG